MTRLSSLSFAASLSGDEVLAGLQGGQGRQFRLSDLANYFAGESVAGVASFNGRDGIVALTDDDVIGALGFTPGVGGTITLSGDVSGSGTTSISVTLGAGAVSLAKMANVASGTVFYRKTGGSGAPEVQTLATLKTDLGLTGTNSGDQTSVSGNAGTATALQTARNINGVAFDGTGNITINAVDSTARVPESRTVSTTAPLSGGGNLSGNLTLGISAATSGAAGSMSAADKAKLDAITGTNTGDQSSIVGIGGTLAQFNAAISDANIPQASTDLTDSAGLVRLATGGTFGADISVPDEAYDATAWNGSAEVPTKNAIRDKIESLSGGSDPWTYVKLGSDFTTTSGTAVDVTGLGFTPAANTQYEFEALLLLRTSSASIGTQPGIAWPTGCDDGVATIQAPTSATAMNFASGNISATVQSSAGALGNTIGSWPARVFGAIDTGASPSGDVKIVVKTESAGTTATVKAGSWIKYREIP